MVAIAQNLTATIRSALYLALAQSVGWLYLHCLVQYLLYHGRSGGEDFGIGTFIMGWVLALVWGIPMFFGLSKRLFGTYSLLGFFLGGILAVPISVPLMFMFVGKDTPLDDICKAVFMVLGLGLLPEGRKGATHAHGAMVIVMLFLSILGTLPRILKKVLKLGGLTLVFSLQSMKVNAYDLQTHEDFLTNEAVDLLNSTHDDTYQEIESQKSVLDAGSRPPKRMSFSADLPSCCWNSKGLTLE